jgi:hypothetical protein
MATHPTKFLAIQDTRVVDGKMVLPPTVTADLVEAPACGFWLVTWGAEHPERGWESGVMLASREPYDDDTYARNVVSEVLWGRGYVGTYRVTIGIRGDNDDNQRNLAVGQEEREPDVLRDATTEHADELDWKG